MAKGKLIVIEGTDGSGKATQAKLLFEKLKKQGHSIVMIDFPQYGNYSAAFVEAYLRGEFGSAEEVGPYRASVFYAIDRHAKSKEMHDWLEQGKIIISNRYTTSNKGHQAGKIKDPEEREKFLNWLDEFEYGIFGIPKPDKVIVLHMPVGIAQKLIEMKEDREYIKGKKKDLHEADLDHLKDAEQTYMYLAEKEGWDVIKCSDGNKPLSIQEIHEKVYENIKKVL